MLYFMQQCHWKACHCHHVTVKCSVLDVSFSMLQEMAASRMLSRNSSVTEALSTRDEQPDRKLQPGLAFCGWTSFKLLLKPAVWGPALLVQALPTTESPNSLLVSRTLSLTRATGGKAMGETWCSLHVQGYGFVSGYLIQVLWSRHTR